MDPFDEQNSWHLYSFSFFDLNELEVDDFCPWFEVNEAISLDLQDQHLYSLSFFDFNGLVVDDFFPWFEVNKAISLDLQDQCCLDMFPFNGIVEVVSAEFPAVEIEAPYTDTRIPRQCRCHISDESHLRVPPDIGVETPSTVAENEKRRAKRKDEKAEHRKRKSKGGRYGFNTRSEAKHPEDGYRWRKYGKKGVTSNPCPRNYYKCLETNCAVRKTTERDPVDDAVFIVSYEAFHNHENPSFIYDSSFAFTWSSSSTSF